MKKLSDIADIHEITAPVSVSHDNGKTYAKVSGTIKGHGYCHDHEGSAEGH
ncbi:hypothetical protein [Paenibacillus alvei]|uniref:hypothetical protein n=1 Tax=Paenibacillus alvei TaxID=44250 RepID=UPI001F16B90D|nr:hypothetical protein [Paenibacillus alvei]